MSRKGHSPFGVGCPAPPLPGGDARVTGKAGFTGRVYILASLPLPER